MSVFKREGSPYYQTEFVYRGRRVVRSTGTSSRREAETFERDLRDKVASEAKSPKIVSTLTLDRACAKYWIEHGRRLRWARDVERNLKYIVTFIERDLPLSELSNKHVAQLAHARLEQGAGPAAVNRTVVVLQGVHNRAAGKWEEPVKVIAWKGHKLKEQGRVRWVTVEEAMQLLDALPPHIRAIVHFLLLTGVRQREAFELTWDRVHLEKGIVEITAKGGVKRDIVLEAETFTLLQQLPRNGRYVFDTTNWRKHFDAAKKTAGITNFRWHDLRHTHATWLRQAGVPLEVVSRSLGHSGIAVTQKYAHVAQHEVRAALQKLPALSPNIGNVVILKAR